MNRLSPRIWRAAVCALVLTQAHALTPAFAHEHVKGTFGPVLQWPMIPIHAVVLPDGRVMTYGSDERGEQGTYHYDVWQPGLNDSPLAHLTLPNTTATDIFCSGQIVMPSSGAVMLAGGDLTIEGTRNYSIAEVNSFDYRTNQLATSFPSMIFKRWYPTVLTTAGGEVLVLGGRMAPGQSVITPEIYKEGQGWRVLAGATHKDAFNERNYVYPKAWQAPSGEVFIATPTGATYLMTTEGTGSIKRTTLNLPLGNAYLPSVMFAPGKVLTLRQYGQAYVVDLQGATPKAKRVAGPGLGRFHASATVLPDGKVFLNGGSLFDNANFGVHYVSQIWDPAKGTWTNAARAAKMRLYHSISILLPDGRVLTGGGGAPGPVRNLNAEVYTPPYLYERSGSGRLAARPAILSAPATATWGEAISVATDAMQVSRVTLVKTGSVTHATDFDQRFMELTHAGAAQALSVTLPASATVAPPGYYMLFVFNDAGVPSVARMIKLG